jgi:RNA polymerase sigma-70 factor (ECF subfamily)
MNRHRDLFWRLTKPEHLRARAFCRKLVDNREDGDDLYQDALVIALTRFDTLRDTSAFRPWLYRIVVNTFRNQRRRAWWKRFVPLTEEIAENAPGEDPVPGLTARRKLRRAFRVASPEDQALVTLFELEGWSIAEMAVLLGRSEGAIKVRLSRIRRKMREALAMFPSQAGLKEAKRTKLSEDDICVAAKSGTD